MVYELADYAMLQWLWDLTPKEKKELMEELQERTSGFRRYEQAGCCSKAPTRGIRKILDAWPAYAQNHHKIAALANRSIPYLAIHSTYDSPPLYDKWLHIETRMIQAAYTRSNLERRSPARRNERSFAFCMH